MGRKNSRAHQPKRRSRSAKFAPQATPRANRIPRPVSRVEKLVLPVGKCGRKLMFTKADAPAALDQAQRRREIDGSITVEKRYYTCDRCGHCHLTSRERWDDRGGSS